MTNIKTGMALAVLLGMAALPAVAAEIIKPPESGNVTISGREHRNVYTAGGNVTITSNVSGDLFSAGGNTVIQGNIEQDLMAAGGTLTVSGNVGGDVRLAGGNITITGQVGGDILIGGGNVTITSTSRVGGDLIAAGGNISIDAPVAGQVMIGADEANINSQISGTVKIKAKRLIFGPQANVPGKVTYQGKKPAELKPGAQVPNLEFKEFTKKHRGLAGLLAVAFFIKLAAFLIAALLAMRFLRRRIQMIVETAHQNIWANLGLGLLVAIVLPVAAVILFATIVGYYTALVLLAWFGTIILIVSLIEAMFLGTLLLVWFKKPWDLSWKTVTLGVMVLGILKLIPFIGFLACLILWLITFGAALRVFKTELTLKA